MDARLQPRPPVLERTLRLAREAQPAWARLSVQRRLDVVRRLRPRLASYAEALAESVERPGRGSIAETLSAEVIPLADACRFLEKAAAILRPRRLGRAGRPAWLWGTRCEVRREPFGVVLVVGPANYPLLLPAVQTLQALVAGNAVLLKPGSGGGRVARLLAALLADSELDPHLLTVLDESAGSAMAAIRAGVDKVVLTGSAETGRAVLAELAPRVTPATVELSGCDAVFVLPGADLELVARAVAFGMTLNGGATCIAPRRLFVPHELAVELAERIARCIERREPAPLELDAFRRARAAVEDALARGARIAAGAPPRDGLAVPTLLADVPPEASILRSDLFAPIASIVTVADADEALEIAARCPFALGATIFGPPGAARVLATRVRAGVVVVNDMIVPTADPRLPFGGRGDSGFGVTRGAEGLLAMTAIKTVVSRRGRFRPYLRRATDADAPLMKAWLETAHGERWTDRIRGFRALAVAVRRRFRRCAEENQGSRS